MSMPCLGLGDSIYNVATVSNQGSRQPSALVDSQHLKSSGSFEAVSANATGNRFFVQIVYTCRNAREPQPLSCAVLVLVSIVYLLRPSGRQDARPAPCTELCAPLRLKDIQRCRFRMFRDRSLSFHFYPSILRATENDGNLPKGRASACRLPPDQDFCGEQSLQAVRFASWDSHLLTWMAAGPLMMPCALVPFWLLASLQLPRSQRELRILLRGNCWDVQHNLNIYMPACIHVEQSKAARAVGMSVRNPLILQVFGSSQEPSQSCLP